MERFIGDKHRNIMLQLVGNTGEETIIDTRSIYARVYVHSSQISSENMPYINSLCVVVGHVLY